MLKPSLCDYSEAYIIAKDKILGTAADFLFKKIGHHLLLVYEQQTV